MANSSAGCTTKFERTENVHRKILYDLMSSIYEYLLISTSENSHDIDNKKYDENEKNARNGSMAPTSTTEKLLLRIHKCIEQIFLNGLRLFKPDKTPDIWRFIEALNWINPLLMVSVANSSMTHTLVRNSRIRSDKALAWIYENLSSHQLETKIIYLLSDTEHLENCYDVTVAFFHNKKFVDALYTCLNALSKNNYNLLLKVDQSLYMGAIDEFIDNAKAEDKKVSSTSKGSNKKLRKHSSRIRCKLKHCISINIRSWVSLPEIRPKSKIENQSNALFRSMSQPINVKSNCAKLTVENLAIKDKQKVPSIRVTQQKLARNSSLQHSDKIKNALDELQPINLVKCDDIKIHFDRRSDFPSNPKSLGANEFSIPTKSNSNLPGIINNVPSKMNLLPLLNSSNSSNSNSGDNGSPLKKLASNSAPGDFASFFTPTGAKIEKSYNSSSILENIKAQSASASIKCSKNSNTMLPKQGQSLTSYLQKVQRSRTNITDLERENAHFNLSDAIISAIEEVKCTRMERKREKLMKSTTKNRKPRQRPRRLKNWVIGDKDGRDSDMDLAEDDNNTGIASEMPTLSRSSSSGSDLSHISSNSDTSTGSKTGDLKCLKIFSVSTHSINDHSAYAEWAENSNETLSAEGIALSLISKFKDYQLPRASDLLISANDQFNAMNRIFDIAPERIYQVPYTRGTPDWAPPRPQIIFTRHPPTDRRSLLEAQKYRCAGCGMHIDVALAHSLRYCDYLGKYHCTPCHRNQISTIPARVLERWDFTCHPVCVFSYRLLDQIWKFPLFRVPDLNKELYARVRSLRYCRLRRSSLKFVYDFIQTCRFADEDGTKRTFDSLPAHIFDDIDIWSMSDFVNVRNGIFLKVVNEIIEKGEEHVFGCELCIAHGFICEYCSDKQVIFPWQTKVTKCPKCGSCSHNSCSTDNSDCHKCKRLEMRKKK